MTVESRPATQRYGGSASVTLGRHVTLLINLEQTRDDRYRELRLMTGMTYRIR